MPLTRRHPARRRAASRFARRERARHWRQRCLRNNAPSHTRTLSTSGGRTFDYDAYGNAISFDASAALTSLLYSGEEFNVNTGFSYLRARYYDPSNGRFTRMDPFAGDINSPLSLHKYGYVHGNPVMGVDPTGLFFTYVTQLTTHSIQSLMRNRNVIAAAKAFDASQNLTDAVKVIGQVVSGSRPDLMLLAGLLASVLPFGSLLEKGAIAGRKLVGASDHLTDALKGFQRAGGAVTDKAAERVGQLGAISVARKLGFEAVENFPTRYRGFDGLFKQGDTFIIVEAKGGAGRLGSTSFGGQLSQGWIDGHIARLRSGGYGYWADQLQAAQTSNRLQALLVTTPANRAAQTVGDPSFVLKAWNEIGPSAY